MAAESGWFPTWYAGSWFPSVWFAPADEEHLTPEEQRPSGGQVEGKKTKPRRLPRPAFIIPPRPLETPRNVEEAEALLLIGAL